MSGTPKKNLGEIADATQLQVLRAKKIRLNRKFCLP
jgi:hypothetical protein